MLKKLTLTIFMMLCALSAAASAQTAASPEKQAAIKELVALINQDNKISEMMDAMIPQLQAQQNAAAKSMIEQQTNLNADEKQSLEDSLVNDPKHSVKRLMEKFNQKLDFNALINEIAYDIYDKHFTLEEIRDINLFYKTPTGQKLLKEITPIAVETMRQMQEKMMPKMMQVIQEITDEDRADFEQQIKTRKPAAKKTGAK